MPPQDGTVGRYVHKINKLWRCNRAGTVAANATARHLESDECAVVVEGDNPILGLKGG